jgi:ATP adenylyltransferase
MKYVESKTSHCIFCGVLNSKDDKENLVVYRGSRCFVMLNRFPYTSGHILVVANEHLPSLEDLSPAARSELMELASRSMTILRKVYNPDAFNMGANIGEAAGAGIAGHVHLHVLGRWQGDTNFMLTLAETKVIPEALEVTLSRITKAWNNT